MNLMKTMLDDAKKNPTVAAAYAKSNCKHCLHKGIITHSIPIPNQLPREYNTLCDCVAKNIKKEIKRGENSEGC